MLSWNVYVEDFNNKEILVYNIFRHYGFMCDCVKIAKKYRTDKDAFAEEIRRSLMYYFWSKCEWEIILDSWPGREGFRQEKIDVYDQVRMNWDAFVDWLWNNRAELKKKELSTGNEKG